MVWGVGFLSGGGGLIGSVIRLLRLHAQCLGVQGFGFIASRWFTGSIGFSAWGLVSCGL